VNSLPQAVISLGFVSLLTDFSSEMIYPLLPVFISQVLGASPAALGIIEGVAESTASLFKLLSGYWSDRTHKKKPFILFGYSASSFTRPLIGLTQTWPQILILRFFDRVGKGLRSSPRDSLIAEVTTIDNRGRAFGFHQGMDHAGAVVGPLVASLLLAIGFEHREIFLWAGVPAILSVLIVLFFVKDPQLKSTPVVADRKLHKLNWKSLNSDFKKYLFALLVFTLGNSTDAFLLLKLSMAGIASKWIPILWAIHNIIRMVSNLWGGRATDRFGPRKLIFGGWILYAVVYLFFGLVSEPLPLIVVFMLYGIYFGLTEPSEKVLVAQLSDSSVRGTAFGFYNATIGLAALPASVLFGWIWNARGAFAAFATGSTLAVVACVILSLAIKSSSRE
jgi:MFS family permease